jgi:hypothetical protein
MRTVTIERTYFTVKELRSHPGSGFGRALDEYASDECSWQDWSDEWASLAALDKHVEYDRHRRLYWDGGLAEAADLTGRRAFAWLENAVLGPLRLPWGYMSAPGPLGVDRRKRARYRERPGTVPSCPFTGYYTDEVLLDSLRGALAAGMSVGDAMLGLEAEIQKVCDDELDYRTSEDAFIEKAEDLGWEFLVDGTRV